MENLNAGTRKIYKNKIAIINRAVPGSGKTTISNSILRALSELNVDSSIHSTDEYFMRGNRYEFDISRLYEYHRKNEQAFEKSLKDKKTVVICDNTNLLPWQTEFYSDAARKFGYKIVLINFLPREVYKHVQSQKITPEKPDAHNVPESQIIKFIENFNDYNDLLDKTIPVNPDKHFNFKWELASCEPVKSGISKYFDYDFLISIKPDEYREIKETIGGMIVGILDEINKA